MSYCVVCPIHGRTGEDEPPSRRVTAAGWLTCDPCWRRMDTNLATIPELHALLDATPGSSVAQDQVTGSRERTLGVRVPVLDLLLPANTGSVHDPDGDQTGNLPTASVLDVWVEEWREKRSQGEHRPVPTVTVLSRWLRDRLDWAAQNLPSLDDFASDMRALTGALYSATGHANSKPEAMGAPCPKCDLKNLTRAAGDDYIECTGPIGCGQTLMTRDEYDRWAGHVAAQYKAA